MLVLTLKKLPETSAYTYLQQPDLHNSRWLSKNNDTKAVIICDKEIKLTEELRTYILYFGYQVGGKLSQYCKQFSNIPIKQEN